MSGNNLSFFENCSTEFHSFISNISLELCKKDSDYKNIDLENRLILKKYPNINNIFEEKEIDGLNKEECNAMAEYLDNILLLRYKEFEEIFFKGYREAYFYFKKCDLLKDNNDKNN